MRSNWTESVLCLLIFKLIVSTRTGQFQLKWYQLFENRLRAVELVVKRNLSRTVIANEKTFS